LVVLTKPDLTATFGEPIEQPDNTKWKVNFKGTHKIPVKIIKCHAPTGELNCSTNPTYYKTVTGSNEIISPSNTTYITQIGLYDGEYQLVGYAQLSNAIRKTEDSQILFRMRLDW